MKPLKTSPKNSSRGLTVSLGSGVTPSFTNFPLSISEHFLIDSGTSNAR